MSAPCQHPEDEREFIKDTGFDCDREWCEVCGAIRANYPAKQRDGSYSTVWGEWNLPKREAARGAL